MGRAQTAQVFVHVASTILLVDDSMETGTGDNARVFETLSTTTTTTATTTKYII